MIIDPTKTGLENFIALISEAANRVFDQRYLSFSLPKPWSNSKYPAQNSTVTATAKPNGPYKGTTSFVYTRMNLADLAPAVDVSYTDTLDFLTFKRALIQSFGLIYADVDFDVSVIKEPKPGEYFKFRLVAKPNSYVYIGELLIRVSSEFAENVRLMEDGTPRLMEDGSPRLMED